MNNQSIVVNGIAYSHDQIINGVIKTQTEFEKTTLDFCADWLKGKEIFQLNTSGSTGTPKQITVTRQQMIMSARMTEKALQLNQGHTALVCLNTKYVAGQMMLVRSLVTGMDIIAVEPSANPLASFNLDHHIDFIALVPYQLQSTLKDDQEKLEQIKVSIIGGGKIEPNLQYKLIGFQNPVYATYGMTETISHIALMKLNGSDRNDYYVALPEVKLKVDDRGCLVIEAPFLERPVYTNDLVDLMDYRHFQWLGRLDNIINTGGVKVVPEEVESVLRGLFDNLGWQHRFFVAGVEDPMLGQKTCLFVEGDRMPDLIINDLRDKIKEQVPRFEVPKDIRFIKKFIETRTGKINRVETIKLFPVKLQ